MVVAGLGLVVNTWIMFGLQHRKSDLNIRAAWIHMLGDAVGSVAIIGGAIAIRFTGWERIDPVLSIVIGGLIVWTAWDIIKESLNVLLEGLPAGLELQKVTSAMQSVEGVMDVHDLHIWTLGSDVHALSCHVLIADQPPSSSESILKQINNVLCARFDIHHTTVQFEHSRCVSIGIGLFARHGGSSGLPAFLNYGSEVEQARGLRRNARTPDDRGRMFLFCRNSLMHHQCLVAAMQLCFTTESLKSSQRATNFGVKRSGAGSQPAAGS